MKGTLIRKGRTSASNKIYAFWDDWGGVMKREQ